MLNGGKAVRDKDGKIIEAAAFQKTEKEAKPGRIAPDRRWFGNTRVISQTALDHFRTALSQHKADPYSVLLKRNKLPMGLLQDDSKATGKRAHIVETEPFANTFGPKAQRKRPRLDIGSLAELGESTTAADEAAAAVLAGQNPEEVAAAAEAAAEAEYHPTRSTATQPIYAKGTSKRIWGELYKVLDSSDVVIHVLDARDPMGTRCKPVVEYLRKEKAHKHLVYVLNKVDLVPTWVTVSITSPHPSPTLQSRPLAGSYAIGLLREWKIECFLARAPSRPRLGCAGTKKPATVLAVGEGPRGSAVTRLSWVPGRLGMLRSDPLVFGQTSDVVLTLLILRHAGSSTSRCRLLPLRSMRLSTTRSARALSSSCCASSLSSTATRSRSRSGSSGTPMSARAALSTL